jgi:hypothetical protein
LKRGLALQRRVWLHWPEEGAVEVATPERLDSYRRHWLVINLYQLVVERVVNLIRVPMQISLAMHGMPSRDMPKFFLRRVARLLGRPRRSAQPPASDHVPAAGADGAPPMVRRAALGSPARSSSRRRRFRFRRLRPARIARIPFLMRRIPPHRFLVANPVWRSQGTRVTSRGPCRGDRVFMCFRA